MRPNGLAGFLPFLLLSAIVCVACSPSASTPASTRGGVIPVACAARVGAVTDVATEPDWRRHAVYRLWVTADGACLVRIDVLADRPGPAHCGWEEARVLVTGIPVGARYTDSRNAANYVRDPDNLFGDFATAAGFDPDAELPEGAVDTGFRLQETELWVTPTDQSAIYLVTGTSIERWPLDPEPAGCM